MKGSPAFSRLVNGFNSFFENRAPSEKNLIVVFVFALILAADYMVFIRPVMRVFSEVAPQLAAEKQKLQSTREDLQNRRAIHERWASAGEKLKSMDARFVMKNEVPAILENLSKLAQECSVKIITLKPADTEPAGPGFLRIPIRLSATAGTHELGKFLAHLESDKIYFKVNDLKISANASDERRHTVELSIETYAKSQ